MKKILISLIAVLGLVMHTNVFADDAPAAPEDAPAAAPADAEASGSE